MSVRTRVLGVVQFRVTYLGSTSPPEVGGQGTWQSAVLGICTVSGDAQSARRRLEKVIDFIEDLHLAEVTDQEVETL